jgi:hypothetical protein
MFRSDGVRYVKEQRPKTHPLKTKDGAPSVFLWLSEMNYIESLVCLCQNPIQQFAARATRQPSASLSFLPSFRESLAVELSLRATRQPFRFIAGLGS